MREAGDSTFELPLFSELLEPKQKNGQTADEIIDGVLNKLDSMGKKKMRKE